MTGLAKVDLEMERSEEMNQELVRVTVRRMALSLMVLYKLFRMVAALDALYTLAREFTQRYSYTPATPLPS